MVEFADPGHINNSMMRALERLINTVRERNYQVRHIKLTTLAIPGSMTDVPSHAGINDGYRDLLIHPADWQDMFPSSGEYITKFHQIPVIR